jgi:hypothetical protein
LNRRERRKTDNQSHQNTEVEVRIARYTGWLVAATILLFIATAFLAYFGFDQASSNRKALAKQDSALKEQQVFDSGQLSIMEQQRRTDSIKNRNDSLGSVAQVNALLKQVAITDTAAIDELRAYIGFVPVGITRPDTLDVKIVNLGQTPAYCESGSFNFDIKDIGDLTPMKGRAVKDTFPVTATFIKGAEPFIFTEPLLPNDKADLQKVVDKKAVLYVWGFLKYRDIFKINRTCYFKWRSAPIDVYNMTPCEDGNDCN